MSCPKIRQLAILAVATNPLAWALLVTVVFAVLLLAAVAVPAAIVGVASWWLLQELTGLGINGVVPHRVPDTDGSLLGAYGTPGVSPVVKSDQTAQNGPSEGEKCHHGPTFGARHQVGQAEGAFQEVVSGAAGVTFGDLRNTAEAASGVGKVKKIGRDTPKRPRPRKKATVLASGSTT